MNGPTGITGIAGPSSLPDREEGGFLPFLRGEDRVTALEVENAELKRRLTVLEATGDSPDEETPYEPQGELTSIPYKAWREINCITPPPSDPKAMDLFAIMAHRREILGDRPNVLLKNEPAFVNRSHITYLSSESQHKEGFWPLFEIDPEKVKPTNG